MNILVTHRWTLVLILLTGLTACRRSAPKELPPGFPEDAPCQSLKGCLGLMHAQATGVGHFRSVDSKVILAVQSFDRKAIPDLKRFTAEKHQGLRRAACVAFAGIRSLNDADLPTLNACIPYTPQRVILAMATINSKRAKSYVMSNLNAVKKILATDDIATPPDVFRNYPEHGVRTILSLLIADLTKPQKKYEPFDVRIFDRYSNSAVALSLDSQVWLLIRSNNASAEQKEQALKVLGAMGPSSLKYKSQLQKIASRHPQTPLSAAVKNALFQMGDPDAVALALVPNDHQPWLQLSHIVWTLNELSQKSTPRTTAGPAVMSLLNNKQWVAPTLLGMGYIGYTDAIDAIVPYLHSRGDWKVVWCAAAALGLLKAKSALPLLRQLMETHWYKPVRDVSTAAIQAISAKDGKMRDFLRVQSGWQSPRPRYKFYDDLQSLGQATAQCKKHNIDNQLRQIQHTGTRPPRIREDAFYPPLRRWGEIDVSFEVTGGANDGWLLGKDRGEFGGELIWYAKDGTFQHIAYCHPRTILQWQSRILLVEGFAHLGSISGIIWEIEMNKDGVYQMTRWETLPGSPRLTYIKPDGSLYVATSQGDLIIHADGTITEAPCMSDTL